MDPARRRLGPVLAARARGALLLAAALMAGSTASAYGSGAEACPAAAGKMPLVKQDVQISDGGGNTVKCDYERYGKKGQFRSGVYLQLAWIEADSSAEPWSDPEVWCGASQFDPTCANSCFIYPRHGRRQLYVNWVASSPKAWDPRPIVERTSEELAAAFAHRAATCPAGYEPRVTAPTVTTIVLSGGPGEEPPAIGVTVPLSEDDRHRIVIGGLDGEVIREEPFGDQATVIGYGPIATDAEGNWSVLVEVEASVATDAQTAMAAGGDTDDEAGTRGDAVAVGTADADAATEVRGEAPDEADAGGGVQAGAEVDDAAPAGAVEPSEVDLEARAEANAGGKTEAAASPTPVPVPEMIGMPEAIADYVAGLEPEAAGAVRDLTDSLAALGDELIQEGAGKVTIDASDLASLRLLVPDVVNEVRLDSGSLVVVTSLIDVRVTPVVGEDGFIEFRTNRLQETIRSHEIVKALVLALNNYVNESGGRFSTISVTPTGLTVTAKRVLPE